MFRLRGSIYCFRIRRPAIITNTQNVNTEATVDGAAIPASPKTIDASSDNHDGVEDLNVSNDRRSSDAEAIDGPAQTEQNEDSGVDSVNEEAPKPSPSTARKGAARKAKSATRKPAAKSRARKPAAKTESPEGVESNTGTEDISGGSDIAAAE